VENQPFHPNLSTVDPVNLLRASADGVRLTVVGILNDGAEYTCSALAAQVGIPLPTMSHHLKTMREAGLTFNRKEGTTRWTSLRRRDLDEHFPGFVDLLLMFSQKL
jgi:Predicted transcriptional regulators